VWRSEGGRGREGDRIERERERVHSQSGIEGEMCGGVREAERATGYRESE